MSLALVDFDSVDSAVRPDFLMLLLCNIIRFNGIYKSQHFNVYRELQVILI